ncbi:MAG: hypothetical protein KDB07_00265, partial [Planctomycetes bacterium]|nr:hypothetical protein [Planctomycetota bacterium]
MRFTQRMAIPVGLLTGTMITLVVAGCGAGAGGTGEAPGDPLAGLDRGGNPTPLEAPVLPATLADYEGYAANLPAHFFTQTSQLNRGSVVEQDNTPEGNPITNAGATLGRVLFYDTKLSA